MKRIITTLALAASMMLLALPALATEGDPVAGCQPGTANALGNTGIEAWELLSQDEYADLLIATFGPEPYPGAAQDRAAATYAFCDKNDDGYACVLKQTFPPNASGFRVSLLALDNHHPQG